MEMQIGVAFQSTGGVWATNSPSRERKGAASEKCWVIGVIRRQSKELMPGVMGMRGLCLKNAKLNQLTGSDLRKVAIALVLQKQTSVRQRRVGRTLKDG